MLRTTLAMFVIGGMSLWGQAKVDRAAAYYHYTLAHMYEEKAIAPGIHRQEYLKKAIENFKAAVQADPNAPVTSEELSGAFMTHRMPRIFPSVVRPSLRPTPLDPTFPTVDPGRRP